MEAASSIDVGGEEYAVVDHWVAAVLYTNEICWTLKKVKSLPEHTLRTCSRSWARQLQPFGISPPNEASLPLGASFAVEKTQARLDLTCMVYYSLSLVSASLGLDR